MVIKIIKYLSVFGIFFFPFALFRSLAFPLSFSHVVLIFSIIQISALLFLLHSFQKGELALRKSYITGALAVYILILFITALTGSEFGYSFWSSYSRGTGIITWLHYTAFFIVLSSVFVGDRDWRDIFRALALSGSLLAIFSFLGRDGLHLDVFAFLKQGGSFLGNTSYSGAYMLLIFFFSIVGLLMEESKKWKIVYVVSMLAIFFNPDLFNFGVFKGSVSILEALKNPMMLVGMARTSSLVLWAGILLTLGLYFLDKLKDKRRVVVWAFTGLVLLFAVYVFGFMSLMSGEGKLHDFYVTNSGPIRPMVWQMAVEGIKDRPILGWGDGNFKYVYQENLQTEMIHLENPPWFDRAHNFTLEELVGHGILGAVSMLSVFLLIAYMSFKFYAREGKLYFLLIPFIFFLHFIQLQTFFQVDSSMLLIFIILSFLVSKQDFMTLRIGRDKTKYQLGALILTLTTFTYFVYFPIKENRVIPLINNTKVRTDRLEAQKRLTDLKIDPVESLRQVSAKFTNETANRAKELEEAGFSENVAVEYRNYINAYENYLPRYENYHRYLYEYANIINTAYIFKVDELKKGEDLARRAIEISDKYPQPFWVLAINLFYQGRVEEALSYAKQAYDLDPAIKKSEEIYKALQEKAKLPAGHKEFFFLAGI